MRCGALLPAEALKPGAGTCPDCRQQLVARSAGVVGFSECARCGGLFLGQKAFEAVAKDADARQNVRAFDVIPRKGAEPEPGFHYRPCPVCHKLMNRSNYGGGSGVIVDVCGPHGVFFDRGELTRIVDFLEMGGWDQVRKRKRQRTEEEISALESRKTGALDLELRPGGGLSGVIGFLASIWRP